MRIYEKYFLILSLVGESNKECQSFVKSKNFDIVKGEVNSLKKNKNSVHFQNELEVQNDPIKVKKAFREKMHTNTREKARQQ